MWSLRPRHQFSIYSGWHGNFEIAKPFTLLTEMPLSRVVCGAIVSIVADGWFELVAARRRH